MSEAITVLRIPYRTQNANAVAERWVRTIREEYLDPVLIFSQPHLQQVLDEYVAFYNQRRPHQGIEQRCPDELPNCEREGIVRCRDVLGGLIHDYYREVD